MILYPAIDIRGGQAVRLLQGDYARETTYDADPVDAAKRWAGEGAEFLHVVDLDGAKAGEPRNLEHVRRIAAAVGCPIQVGGGLRDLATVASLFEAGAERVVIGTAALRDPEFLDAALERHGDRVVVSVDARGGSVSLSGWTEQTGRDVAETVRELSERGVARFLCTEIDVDGTMDGPALDELARIAAAARTSKIIASGGVGALPDLHTIAELGERNDNLEGAIVGRALYERRFSVAEGIDALAR
ncbi:MAG TPA: 1-(5-phosphoribosyl)-5-[(5-phosphoribosylamino)methylideneamino]imidazole-4-carboxamide isomerase [Solirubrobacterales bacterium]|nr:1-(5-phosphoribosyl)-5-[(5-phosphoribosylamino)methylideneamino]imidazole-4-carboxamide isomerase [Solirubrobacterales bacterium]